MKFVPIFMAVAAVGTLTATPAAAPATAPATANRALAVGSVTLALAKAE